MGQLWPFRYRGLPLQGGLVQLGADWPELVEERGYGDCAAEVLGEALCSVALLAGLAKNPPRLTMQLSGVPGLDLLVAQTLRPGQLRGMIKPVDLATSPFQSEGRLVMTLEGGGAAAGPQQSIVALGEGKLAHSLTRYFEQSEQLPSRVYLHADTSQAFGLIVQRVGGDEADIRPALSVVESWALNELPPQPETFLAALLEHDIELLEPYQSWRMYCHCDESSVSRMLLGMGVDEARSLVAERGSVQVECGYCGAQYRYDAAHVEQLFHAEATAPDNKTH